MACVIRESLKLDYLRLIFKENTSKEITAEDMAELVASFQSSRIQDLILDKQDANLAPILDGVKSMVSLRNLCIFFDPTPEELAPLARAVGNPNLLTFSTHSAVLSADLWPILIPVLSVHPSLSALEISSDSPVYRALGEILAHNSSIQLLTLSSELIGTDGIVAFLDGLAKNTTLGEMYLAGISTEAADLLFKTFACDQIKIHTLKMSSIPFNEETVKTLTEALKTNKKLQILELNECVSSNSGKTFFSGLVLNQGLKSLVIGYNTVDSDGIAALAEYLKLNSCLEELDLTYTGTNDEHCKVLADALLVNKTLKKLTLNYCEIKSEGVKALCAALKKNTAVRHLDLDGNVFGVEALTGVKEVLALNTTLERLYICCNYNSENSIDEICAGLTRNNSLRNITIRPDESEELYRESKLMETKIAAVLEHNYAIDYVRMFCRNPPEISEKINRNRQLKSEVKYKVATLSHNIARSQQLVATLPRELWQSILSSVTHPGIASFSTLVRDIFASQLAQTRK